MDHYHFKRTPCGKWDVSHGVSGYDGRFTTQQARSFAHQLIGEGNAVFTAPDGKPVTNPDVDLEPLLPGWRA